MSKAWLNGRLVDERSASVSVRDVGFLHGVGVFTTLRASGSRIRSLAAHLKRLRSSCETFAIPLTYSDTELESALNELLGGDDTVDSRLRITVTRGSTSTNQDGELVLEPTVLITATRLEPYPVSMYQFGMTVLAYDAFKLNPYDPQAGHKTLDYLSRFSALREAQQRGANEAILFNVHNYLQSGAISNVFLVKNDELLTPPTQDELRDQVAKATPYSRSNVLPGVTRTQVIELARSMSIEVSQRGLTVNDLLDADEIFLTNSVMGLMPVCRIERKEIGAGKPGPMLTSLSEAYAKAGAA